MKIASVALLDFLFDYLMITEKSNKFSVIRIFRRDFASVLHHSFKNTQRGPSPNMVTERSNSFFFYPFAGPLLHKEKPLEIFFLFSSISLSLSPHCGASVRSSNEMQKGPLKSARVEPEPFLPPPNSGHLRRNWRPFVLSLSLFLSLALCHVYLS